MSIVKTITNDYEFWEWLKQSDNYRNKFTLEGAKALQAYLDEYSYELDDTHDVEFDPIAWCVEFSEYDSFDTFKSDNGWSDKDGGHEGYPEIKTLEDLRDNTTVIEFDGGIIVQDF